MTLSILENTPVDDAPKAPAVTQYHYDLRLEIGAKDETEIQVATIFYDLVKRMQAVVDDGTPMTVMTATDQLFSDDETMTSAEFQKAFKVDKTQGKFQKVLLGFKLRTTTKLYDIKQRLLKNYLSAHDLFLREHVGGFDEGVKVFSYGFLKDDHPDHPDIPALKTRFARWISDAWKKMDKDDKQKWKEEVPQVFYGPGGLAIPVNFSKERISAAVDGKAKITTTALMVTTPSKYGPFLRDLLNSAVLNKRINNLIPLAYSREDPESYYNILVNQERFMENHRNIPILHAPLEAHTTRGIKGATLAEILHANKDILRVSHDIKQEKFHVSTYGMKYKAVHQWITKTLVEHQFPYGPRLRPLKYGNDTKFSSVLSTAASITSTTDTTERTTRSAPWKQRPPLNISYVLSPAAFPNLPKANHKIPVTPSTSSETLDEDTIQSAISAALSKLEAQHKAELAILKQEMQNKMDQLENQIQEMTEKVAVRTYQALVQEESPLVTKNDHVLMQHEINGMSKQLSALVQILTNSHPQDGHEIQSPPRTTKRTKPSTTPQKITALSEILTQETPVTSATSDPDEGMEGCEY
jgi:hypothetical protein